MSEIVEKNSIVRSPEGQEIGSSFNENGDVNFLYYKENKGRFSISLFKKTGIVYTQNDTCLETEAVFTKDNGYASVEIFFNKNGEEVDREFMIYDQPKTEKDKGKPVLMTFDNVADILGIKDTLLLSDAEEITKLEIDKRAPGTIRQQKRKNQDVHA